MALNLEGFSTPEKSYGQLYNLGDAAERRDYRREQLQQREEGRRAATGTFLSNYLDKKDFLTGTNYDPEIVRRLDEMMVMGAELATKGATTPEIMMALGPKVGEVSEYSTKAKLVNQNLEKQLEYLKTTKGYDPVKLREEARRLAFYGPDGKLKDIGSVDPSQDFVMETIRMSPEKVTNDAALDEFVKNSPKYVETKDITTYAPTGMMNKKKMKVTSPDWLTIDNGELVPEFEVATDGGQPIMHDFVGEDGKVTKAPVRMIRDDRFNSIMRSNPGIADYVRGQVKAQLGDGDINSVQAKNLAKAILYDELKKRKGGGMEEVEIQNKPSAPEIRMAFTGSPYAPRSSRSGGGSGDGGGIGAGGGNAFDGLTDAQFKNFKISDGVFYNNDGSPKSGRVFITGDRIPAAVKSTLKAGGINPTFLIKGVDAEIVDGKIVSMSNKLIGTVTREDMEGVYQPKFDTEPQKAKKLQFAKDEKTNATKKDWSKYKVK